MTINDLPALNAFLNSLAAILLIAGWWFIGHQRRGAHRAAMLSAVVVSALFLTSYVVYHASAGSRPFPGTGPIRGVYFTILITHVILAATIVPMVLMAVSRALKGRFDRHVRIARWTLPLWLYVSVTGVVIYAMLY
jgi:putative membrane protein